MSSVVALSSTVASAKCRCSVAILAGWLGCQPKNLRRYEELYHSLNWHTLSVIAPPNAVCESFELSASQVASLADDAHRPKSWEDLNNHQIRNMATNVLRDIEREFPHCAIFVVHAFSNGGCLLYEAIRNILLDRGSLYCYSRLHRKFGGVIFDSCPGLFHDAHGGTNMEDGLAEAMMSCSIEEQQKFQAKRRAITELERINPMLKDRKLQLISERSKSFTRGMESDPLICHQLFLYSTADKLIPHQPLKRLIEHNKRRSEAVLVMEKNFVDSPHILHFRHHPVEYRNAVQEFLTLCSNSLNV
jgi:hypothetical protein